MFMRIGFSIERATFFPSILLFNIISCNNHVTAAQHRRHPYNQNKNEKPKLCLFRSEATEKNGK